ncbi:MAG: response regulator [Rhodobacterales bacterium]|nr:response regulator [Rhodobacterales bacterium]
MSVVWLVDDDAAILRGLERLLNAEGFVTRCFQDAATFLDAHDPALAGCAVIDLGLRESSGLALQDRLAKDGGGRPVIFLTGQSSIPTAVQAMRAGAVDYLTKPVEADTLLAAIRSALELDHARRRQLSAERDVRALLASLTPRESEVLQEIVSGRLNKQIAHRLGAAEKTIKVHRGRVMQKMGVRSVAELVTLMSRLQDARSA